MDDKLKKRLKQLEVEDIIWLILIGIIILAFYANDIERVYLLYKEQQKKQEYRFYQIIIFSIACLTYLYYTIDAFLEIKELTNSDSKTKVEYTYLSFIGSFLVLVGGLIFLYIVIHDEEVEIEIAL